MNASLNSTIVTERGKCTIKTGDIETAFNVHSPTSAAVQIANLHAHVQKLRRAQTGIVDCDSEEIARLQSELDATEAALWQEQIHRECLGQRIHRLERLHRRRRRKLGALHRAAARWLAAMRKIERKNLNDRSESAVKLIDELGGSGEQHFNTGWNAALAFVCRCCPGRCFCGCHVSYVPRCGGVENEEKTNQGCLGGNVLTAKKAEARSAVED